MVARLRSIATMIFRRSRWEEELKEELQFHLEARADALVRAGLSHEEAMRRARVEFGRLDRSKEGCREARGGRWIDELSRNLVVAGRSIRKNPGFSSTTVEVEMRAAFARVSADIEVDAGPIEEAVQRSLGRDRLVARLSAVFGVLGILLASMGLYAAIARSVSTRTREIGFRIAVGASARCVSWMVLKQSLGVTAVGLLIGLPLAIAGSRLISSLLFEVSPSDPATLIASATVLAVTGLLAGWWPARRAARLDPSKTLRFE